MKKQLFSILTAIAMTLLPLPLTGNAAELDEYINSSDKELSEFFEGFAVDNEYQRDNGVILTTNGSKIISLNNSDNMNLDIYPTDSENIEKILIKCQTYFEDANIKASYITDECLSLNVVNVPREKVEAVCAEITAEFEIERINLRTTDYQGSKYTGSYSEDGFGGGLYKDINLISDEVLFSKEEIKYEPNLSCNTRIRTEALGIYVPKTTTTAPPKTTVTTTAKAEETNVKFDVDIQFHVDAYTRTYVPEDTDFSGKIQFFEKDTVSETPSYFPVLKAMTPVAEYSFTTQNGKCTVENIELKENCEVVIRVDELPAGYCSRYGTEEVIYWEGSTYYYANQHKTIPILLYETTPVIPCDDDFDIGFKLTDSKGDIIENVDCTIYEYSRADKNSPYIRQTVAEFNTSEYPEGYSGKMHITLDKANDYTDNYITVALDNIPEKYQESYNKKKDNQFSSFSDGVLIKGFEMSDLVHNKIKQEGKAVFDPNYTTEYYYNNYYNPFDINLRLLSEEDYASLTTTVPCDTIIIPTITTTALDKTVNELYFNCQYDYIPAEVGFNCGVALAGYDDYSFYEVGDSPIEFTVENEKVAKIAQIQGLDVNITGVSVGETMLNAKTPDGRTASIKIVVSEAPSTSTTAVWEHSTTTTTMSIDKNYKAGDANCDGNVSLADAVLILQAFSNPDVYGVNGTSEIHITEIGSKNADVYETGSGLTPQDALSVQKYMLKLITKLPE